MKQFGSEAIETPFDMPETPEGWQIALLGQIAQIVGGGTPNTSDSSNFSEGEYPWITPADLSGFNEMYISRGRRSLSEQGLKTSSAALMPKGTVLMSSRAPIGYLAIAANELCTNQGFKSFICPPGVTPEYVFFWLKFITPFLENMGSGSTFLEISGSRARKIPILLAPTSEQKRIVTKVEEPLTRVNTTKERLAKVPMTLKRFRQAVLAAACSGRLTTDWRDNNPATKSVETLLEAVQRKRFQQANTVSQKQKLNQIYSYQEEGNSDSLPENSRYLALDKLCYSFQYGTSQKSQQSGKVTVLRMGNIQNGGIDWSDLVYTSDDEEIEKYKLNPGDVLFNRTNSPELVGKTGIYRGDHPAIFAGYLIKIHNFEELDSRYLNFCLNTIYARDFCLKVKTDGVSQSNINAQKLGKFEVPFCPLEEQLEIVRRVESMFKLADVVEKRVAMATARAKQLTQAILAKAFRGELVPTEAELARREGRSYEPASDLLARIKSDKEMNEISVKLHHKLDHKKRSK